MEDMNLGRNLANVWSRINAASLKNGPGRKPRLVAVSKIKPKEMIVECYEHGQRFFGENYIQELVEKSNDPEILDKCPDIKWHFIGHLQRNKVNQLVKARNIDTVETVDTEKLASSLNSAWEKNNAQAPLNVMVQVNTSGEEEKSGCAPDQTGNLVKHILNNCKSLKFAGLMTIGQFGYDYSAGPNPDFLMLRKCRDDVCKELEMDLNDVELSMGMSDDFEHAIELGSTNVRIGTTIFGVREKKVKEKSLP